MGEFQSNDSKSTSNPRRAAAWFGFSVYLNSALVLAATPIFTRLLSPAEYGQVALFNSWLVVITVFSTLNLAGGFYESSFVRYESGIGRFTSSLVGITGLLSTALIAAIAVLHVAYGDFFGLPAWLLAYVVIHSFCNNTFSLWRTGERFAYRYKYVVLLSAISSVLGIGGTIIALKTHIFDLNPASVRSIGVLLPITLLGGYLTVKQFRDYPCFFDRAHWQHAASVCIPLIPHYLAQAFLQQLDKVAINAINGPESLGLYGLASAIASGLTLFWTAVNSSFNPWLYRKLHSDKLGEGRDAIQSLLIAVGALCVVGSLLAPIAVMILAPESYAASAAFIPGLLLASFLQFAQSIFLTIQFHLRQATKIAWVSMTAAAFSVAANWLFLPQVGVAAAPFVLAAGQLAQLVMHRMLTADKCAGMVSNSKLTVIVLAAAMPSIGSLLLSDDRISLRLALSALTIGVGLVSIRKIKLKGDIDV